MLRALSVLSLATAVAEPALARTIHVNSCVMTIGSFCPVETVGGAVFMVALFAFAGFPLRWVLRRHMQNRAATEPGYVPSGSISFLYRNAGRLTLLVAGIIIAVMVFSGQ